MNGGDTARALVAMLLCARQAKHDERSFVMGQEMECRIEGARALVHGRLEDTSVHFGSEAGVITGIGMDAPAERTID
ncbi:MAG TPA: hypothetical protein VE200_00450, partial [Xanthobacteraceae bacterium]|nr:hypothetical protein [Xanthobacteraceae bacterium]